MISTCNGSFILHLKNIINVNLKTPSHTYASDKPWNLISLNIFGFLCYMKSINVFTLRYIILITNNTWKCKARQWVSIINNKNNTPERYHVRCEKHSEMNWTYYCRSISNRYHIVYISICFTCVVMKSNNILI